MRGTKRGGHQVFDPWRVSLITPPNFGGGAGSCVPSSWSWRSANPERQLSAAGPLTPPLPAETLEKMRRVERIVEPESAFSTCSLLDVRLHCRPVIKQVAERLQHTGVSRHPRHNAEAVARHADSSANPVRNGSWPKIKAITNRIPLFPKSTLSFQGGLRARSLLPG